MKSYFGALILAALILASSFISPAFSGSIRFWATESPLGKLNDTDIELLKDAARDALNNHIDGEETHWSNPATGHSGSILVSNTQKKNGQTCRETVVKINAISIKGSSEYLLCAQKDGTWKIAS